MNEIKLTKEEFKLFNQDDQFGFFYDEDGFPKDNADTNFESDVDELYTTFEFIIIDSNDNVFGVKGKDKILYFEGLMEAYEIASEVKHFQ